MTVNTKLKRMYFLPYLLLQRICNNKNSMIEKLGGRKYIYTVLLTLLSFVFMLLGKLTPKEFLDFAIVIGGVYTAGNVVGKFSNNKR